MVFDDLNNDGRSERLVFISDTLGFSSLELFEGDIVHGHWKFKGKLARGIFYACGDFDHNGFKEIYLFTTYHDSLFLHAVEGFTTKTVIRDKVVRKLHLINGIFDIHMHPSFFIDLNNDNREELVFTISTGYNYKDRVIYGLFIREDSLIRSPVSASCISHPTTFLKTDTNIFITGVTREPGNTHQCYPYSDSLAWIMVWDKDLEFLFPPLRIGQYPAVVHVKPFLKEGKVFFAALYTYGGIFDTSKLFLINRYGRIINEKTLSFLKGKTAFMPYGTKEVFTIIDSDGIIHIFKDDLQETKTLAREPVYYYSFLNKDLTGDKVPDQVLYTKDLSGAVFFDPATLTMIPIDIHLGGREMAVSLLVDKGNNYICFDLPGEILYYKFSVNFLYKVRYLIPVILFLMIMALIWGIKKIFDHYLNKRLSRQNEINRLQLLNVKNQIDSHFAFNMIDCIGNSFRKNDFETADRLFIRYARLLQQSVQLSGEMAISLEQEMDYIENYLVLERVRSDLRFDYRIDNRVHKQLKIPKFIIFTFVENAVKHGVLPLTGRKGEIVITAEEDRDTLTVTVTDNGVGMDTVTHQTRGIGSGLKIVDRLIGFFRVEYKMDIDYQIESEKDKGTKIYITFRYGN